MSESFVKLIRSEEMRYLARKHPNAFILLTFIAERARRENGHPDGLTIGQCHIGDYKEYGLTEKEYRTAKKILEHRNHIKIIETNRTRKSSRDVRSSFNFKNVKKETTERATKSTTIGTLVEICSLTVYDINPECANQQKGDRNGDRGATEGRPRGDEQEGRRRNKKDHPSIPSFGSDRMSDDFSSKAEIVPGIWLSQADIDTCIKLKGSIENVREAIEFIQASKSRKHPIADWPNALSKWKIERKSASRIEENIALAEKLSKAFSEFKEGNGWRCYIYHDKKKDQKGLLIEPESPYLKSEFIPFSDGEFKEKCLKIININRMEKNETI